MHVLNVTESGRVFMVEVTIKMNYDLEYDKYRLGSVESIYAENGIVDEKSGKRCEKPVFAGLLPTIPVEKSVDNVEESRGKGGFSCEF